MPTHDGRGLVYNNATDGHWNEGWINIVNEPDEFEPSVHDLKCIAAFKGELRNFIHSIPDEQLEPLTTPMFYIDNIDDSNFSFEIWASQAIYDKIGTECFLLAKIKNKEAFMGYKKCPKYETLETFKRAGSTLQEKLEIIRKRMQRSEQNKIIIGLNFDLLGPANDHDMELW